MEMDPTVVVVTQENCIVHKEQRQLEKSNGNPVLDESEPIRLTENERDLFNSQSKDENELVKQFGISFEEANDFLAGGKSMFLGNIENLRKKLNFQSLPLVEESNASFEKLIEMDEFCRKPIYPGDVLKLRVIRDRTGAAGFLYPTFSLALDFNDGSRHVVLLKAKKKIQGLASCYIITSVNLSLTKSVKYWTGKLLSNTIGTSFTLYDNGVDPNCNKILLENKNNDNYLREELVTICYEPNIFGLYGPRKISCYIPRMLNEFKRLPFEPKNNKGSIIEKIKRKDLSGLSELKNKEPIFREDTRSYVLNFDGRVTQRSVKNFQIVHKDLPDYIILQFGKVGKDFFNLDIRYPLCPLQAFAIALSNFDRKLACS